MYVMFQLKKTKQIYYKNAGLRSLHKIKLFSLQKINEYTDVIMFMTYF